MTTRESLTDDAFETGGDLPAIEGLAFRHLRAPDDYSCHERGRQPGAGG